MLGQKHSWRGRRRYEQLGQRSKGSSDARQGGGLTDAVELALGQNHSCARRATGAVVCWGDNIFHQIGDGTDVGRLVPTPVTGLTDATHIAVGTFHSCAIRAGGGVVCWGESARGQLGDGTRLARTTPVAVVGL